MNEKKLTKKSKFLSRVLRHKPEEIGLELDDHGWAYMEELCCLSEMSWDEIEEIVEKNNKKRFEFSEDGTMIRACQGHSIDVNLDLKKI